MCRKLAAIFLSVHLFGCATDVHLPFQPVPVCYDNPTLLRATNHELVWDGIVDVVSQYFRIEREDPIRQLGNCTWTAGRIDTFPKPGGTLLEPWENDSANSFERLESTLQSVRRYSVVKVIPAQSGGFWVDVAVFKELENIRRPEHATAGSATFRNDLSPARPTGLDQPPVVSQNWIPQGRDSVLEQRILGQILNRFTPEGTPVPVN
jgi:hypothetical protein